MPISIANLSKNETVETLALIDSRAGGKFINREYAELLELPTQKLNKPVTARNVDRTINKAGTITCYVDLPLKVDGRTVNTQLLITELGSQQIILSFPWLREHNPDINLQTGEFKWRPLRPLKIKRYHEEPMRHAKRLVRQELNGMEQPIQSIETDDSLLVKLHSDQAQIPRRGSTNAAGYDLFSAEDKVVPPLGKALIDTQISIAVLPGTYGRIAP